jgi:glycosyltransferase involved in cell wall biosynthesis
MREIVINGRFMTRRMTGVDRFAYEILNAIDELVEISDQSVKGLKFKIVVPRNSQIEQRFRHVVIEEFGVFKGQLWEQLDLPFAVGKVSLLLSLCNTGPVFCRKHVVVIHDAATVRVASSYSHLFRLWYRILIPLLGRFSQRVLTVSAFSKQDISSAFGIPCSKIGVVSEGGEHILRAPKDETAIQRFGLVKGRYVLAVSSMAAHKNFKLLIEALAKIDSPTFDIAVVGGANLKIFGSDDLVDFTHINKLGYVNDSDLRSLYEAAMCFVFPSLYEGFGLPPLEAMNCGCPVLASNAASMPEVCGEAALYFNPHSANELAQLLLKVATNDNCCANLEAKGYVRAAQFSWHNAARQVVAECVCN